MYGIEGFAVTANAPYGAPFPASAAENGCSVDPVSGAIVLGNDVGSFLAQLLSIREIQMNNMAIDLVGSASKYSLGQQGFSILDTFFGIGDMTANVFGSACDLGLTTDSSLGNGPRIQLTDLLASDTTTLNKVNTEFSIRAALGKVLSLDLTADLYRIGDIGNVGSGLKLQMGSPNDFLLATALGSLIEADQASGVYAMGDIPGTGNGTVWNMDDTNELFRVATGLGDLLRLDKGQNRYTIGDSQQQNNGLNFALDDTTGVANLRNTNSDAVYSINGTPGLTATQTPVTSITTIGGLVTAMS